MNRYEVVCIADPTLGKENIEAVVEKVSKKIEGWGGKITKVSNMGNKELSTTFRSHKKTNSGIYFVIHFEAAGTVPADLNNFLRISEEVMRHMIVRMDDEEIRPLDKKFTPQEQGQEKKEEKVEINPEMLVKEEKKEEKK